MDHTVVTLQSTPYPPLPRSSPPEWMNSYSTSWWSLLLIYRPREDERLSWPCWQAGLQRTVYPPINGYPSAAGPVQISESSPVRDRRIVSEMTYNVSMGTLNPTIPYHTTQTIVPFGIRDCRSAHSTTCARLHGSTTDRCSTLYCLSSRHFLNIVDVVDARTAMSGFALCARPDFDVFRLFDRTGTPQI